MFQFFVRNHFKANWRRYLVGTILLCGMFATGRVIAKWLPRKSVDDYGVFQVYSTKRSGAESYKPYMIRGSKRADADVSLLLSLEDGRIVDVIALSEDELTSIGFVYSSESQSYYETHGDVYVWFLEDGEKFFDVSCTTLLPNKLSLAVDGKSIDLSVTREEILHDFGPPVSGHSSIDTSFDFSL